MNDILKYFINWCICVVIFLCAAYGGIMLFGPIGFIAGVLAAGAYASATKLV